MVAGHLDAVLEAACDDGVGLLQVQAKRFLDVDVDAERQDVHREVIVEVGCRRDDDDVGVRLADHRPMVGEPAGDAQRLAQGLDPLRGEVTHTHHRRPRVSLIGGTAGQTSRAAADHGHSIGLQGVRHDGLHSQRAFRDRRLRRSPRAPEYHEGKPVASNFFLHDD